jgi:tRNA threonylcarbamoyladenosine biosynthesis protein TsaE
MRCKRGSPLRNLRRVESSERRWVTRSETETRMVAAEFGKLVSNGDVVLLEGRLGAGKTTFVRGMLESLGHAGPVRSPTFNLIQTFDDVVPPVVHADLYRLESARGLGLEDYLGGPLVLIEWPDRLGPMIDPCQCWRISISFEGVDRVITINPPQGINPTR